VKDGDGFNINVKAYKGNLLANAGESGTPDHAVEPLVYDDFMRVVKMKGTYEAPVGSQGKRGDTFDSSACAIMVAERAAQAAGHFPGRGDLRGTRAGPAPELDAERTRFWRD